MPLNKLKFQPGINKEITSLSGEGGWFDCDKIRFRGGFPEKIGGWASLTLTPFLGVCRSLWNWITLNQYNLLGIGTHLKFYVENGATYYDITPIRATTLNTTTFVAGATTLNGAINLSVDEITLTSAANFPASGGIIKIDNEQISYFTKVGNVLTGCERGINGTVAASHLTAAVVGSAMLTVSDSGASNLQVNDFLTFSSAVTLGGNMTAPVLNQEYQILALVSNTSYIIQARAAVTGNVATTNGGAPVFATAADSGNGGGATDTAYQISTGLATYVVGTGWGTGPWSRGPWGSGFTSGIGLQLRLWNQSNYGQDLIFSPKGGPLYLWQPGAGVEPAFGTRGLLIGGVDIPGNDVPVVTNFFTVSDATRIVICFGCNDYGLTAMDPMLIRWSVQEDYTDWTPAATNQAGSFRLSHGSQIIGALQTRQEIIVWTDSSVYSMQYLGPPYVWGFTLLADNISIASTNAMATATGVVFWMGVDKFYMYAGRVETLPCSVRKYVFNDINIDQTNQFFASTSEGYNEVWWFYCSAGSDEINKYVIFNYQEKAWYIGTLNRTAWLDSPLRQFPIAATGNNTIVYHEAIVDNGETNPPSPISCYIQSSDFDIGEGEQFSFVWRMIPDVNFNGSTTPLPLTPKVTFKLRPRTNPGSAYGTTVTDNIVSKQLYNVEHAYEVQEFTEIVYTRVRGRQLAFRVESNTLGTQWQLGSPAIDIKPDGRK
jgi:hypothetical protein